MSVLNAMCSIPQFQLHYVFVSTSYQRQKELCFPGSSEWQNIFCKVNMSYRVEGNKEFKRKSNSIQIKQNNISHILCYYHINQVNWFVLRPDQFYSNFCICLSISLARLIVLSEGEVKICHI